MFLALNQIRFSINQGNPLPTAAQGHKTRIQRTLQSWLKAILQIASSKNKSAKLEFDNLCLFCLAAWRQCLVSCQMQFLLESFPSQSF
jgi:hypothetical protein